METELSTAYIFINYANEDSVFALQLYDELQTANQSAWIDQRDVGRDERWHQAINRALHACSHMILVWSKAAESTSEVESEWVHFTSHDKPILIVLRDRQPVHYNLQKYPTIDFTSDPTGALKKLLTHLNATQRDPRTATVAIEQGNAASRSYDYTTASKCYNRALSLDPASALAYYSRGVSYLQLNHTERALQDFQSAIREDPGMAEAYYYQGMILRTHDGSLIHLPAATTTVLA